MPESMARWRHSRSKTPSLGSAYVLTGYQSGGGTGVLLPSSVVQPTANQAHPGEV